MSGLGEAASKIGEKIVDILDVFDLSFFISGAVVMAALLQSTGLLVRTLDEIDGAGVFGLVLGSYVLGLICFGVGRPIRVAMSVKRNAKPDHEVFHEALLRQGLQHHSDSLQRYFGHRADITDASTRLAMYTRMWAHVRSYPELQSSFSLLNRYWVLSASYDGIAIAALVWLLPVWQPVFRTPGLTSGLVALGWTLAIALAVIACWHRALEYKRYQIEELVATVAHWLCLIGRRELEASVEATAPSQAPQEDA